jgi:hypothetical protein
VQAGQVLPGSIVAADLHGTVARVGDVPVHVGRAALSFEARAGPPPHAAHAALELSSVRVGEAATIASARLALDGEPPDLARPQRPRAAHLAVDGGRIVDAKAAAALATLPEDVRIDGGHGDFALALDGPPDALRGTARVALSEMKVHASGVHVGANVELRAAVRSFDPARGGDLDGTRIDVDHARVINPGGEEDTAPDWWAHVALPRAALRRRALDADLLGRCRDARPIVGLYVRRSQLPGFLSGLFAMDDLALRGSAIVAPDLFGLRDLTAQGDGASVRAAYRSEPSGKRGAALLDAHGITVGVSLGDGGSSVHLGAATAWFADAEAKLEPGRAVPPLGRRRATPSRRTAQPVQTPE